MDDTMQMTKEVPGSYGPPMLGMLGDTYDFMFSLGWKAFFEARRIKLQSTVFKANLFEKTIVVLDHEAMTPLLQWDGRLRKDNRFGWAKPPSRLVGGIVPSVFQPVVEHDQYKSLYMSILAQNASTLETVFAKVFTEYAQRWLRLRQFNWDVEIERFWVSFIFEWYFGARPDEDDVRYVYLHIFTHPFVKFSRFIPWSRYRRSIPKFDRLIEFVKTSPRFCEYAATAEGHGLHDKDALAKQLLFLTGMNNFLGLQGMTKALIGELSIRPGLRKQIFENSIEGEVAEILPDHEMLDAFLREVMRLHPPVFFIYGRANEEFVLGSSTGNYRIPKDSHLMGVLPIAQRDPRFFPRPDDFELERYQDPLQNEKLIWPHDAHDAQPSESNHGCPGKNVAMILGKLFAINLEKSLSWELIEDAVWSEGRFELNIASPIGKLPVKVAAKQ